MIFGPPAAGKMTVGRELSAMTGFPLFHNHMTVEPVLEVFEFGTPPFARLVTEFRRRILEEAADSGMPGLVFTFVWALDDAGDKALVDSFAEVVERRGGTTAFAELYAPLDVRLERNRTPLRLDAKRSKRDLEASDGWLREADRSVLNTGGALDAGALLGGRPHVRVDNTALSPEQAARRIIEGLGLPVV